MSEPTVKNVVLKKKQSQESWFWTLSYTVLLVSKWNTTDKTKNLKLSQGNETNNKTIVLTSKTAGHFTIIQQMWPWFLSSISTKGVTNK